MVVNVESFSLHLHPSHLPPFYLLRTSIHSFVTFIPATLYQRSRFHIFTSRNKLSNTGQTPTLSARILYVSLGTALERKKYVADKTQPHFMYVNSHFSGRNLNLSAYTAALTA